jgi:hypothetical protein
VLINSAVLRLGTIAGVKIRVQLFIRNSAGH